MSKDKFLGVEVCYANGEAILRKVFTDKFSLDELKLGKANLTYTDVDFSFIKISRKDKKKMTKIDIEEFEKRIFFVVEYEDQSKEIFLCEKCLKTNQISPIYSMFSSMRYGTLEELEIELLGNFLKNQVNGINILNDSNIGVQMKNKEYLLEIYDPNDYYRGSWDDNYCDSSDHYRINIYQINGKLLQAIDEYYLIEDNKTKFVINKASNKLVFAANGNDEIEIEEEIAETQDAPSYLIIKVNGEVKKYPYRKNYRRFC